MKRREFITKVSLSSMALALGALSGYGCSKSSKQQPPHIIYILADDMGYGDVRYQNPESEIPTPNIDRLAANGLQFSDAHSGSAVCTPTRYGVLTGRYSWRTRLKHGVLFPPADPLISPDRMTVASLLKSHGYYTACIGKWHLGLGWAKDGDKIDFTQPITGGPTALGFDSFFGIAGSLDMPPYCYIKDDRVTEIPTVQVSREKFGRPGLAMEGLEPEDVLPRLTTEATTLIRQHARTRSNQPLFLYFPLTAPHKPVAPSKQFQGKTSMGDYGDFVCEVDWTVGQVIEALKSTGMMENSLVIFTADNGASPNAARSAMERGHDPTRPLRGMKSDIWEGGHRVPFIVHWPGHTPQGKRTDKLICLTDLLATAAEILDVELPNNAGEDSFSMLPFLGNEQRNNQKEQRQAVVHFQEAVVHHSIQGYFAIRKGPWKLCLCAGSGGWAHPTTAEARNQGLPSVQLYNMEQDIAEKKNVYEEHPEIVRELKQLLTQYINKGRSTPGTPQQNWQGKNHWKQVNWQ